MERMLKVFQLRPHGDRLLTKSAAAWLSLVRIPVLAMALSEMLAWGYLGFLFGDGWLRWAAALFMGAVVFSIVWAIDVSLVTLDRAWSEHAELILGQRCAHASRKRREAFTFTLRIGLLLGSLTITAPYLAQLVFYKDIDQLLTQEAASRLDAARRSLVEKHDASIAAASTQLRDKQSEYEKEVAGTGGSRKYGFGPAAAALQQSVERLQSDLAELSKQKDAELRAFDDLARGWRTNRERLAADYNLALPKATIYQSSGALEQLRQRPENRRVEFAIKAFLAIIFAALLLMKLFEPSSVRLYLSEVLQQEYERYLAGTFDSALPPTETSTRNPSAMSPQRFYAFLVAIWAPARRLEERQAEARARTVTATQSLETLERMRIHAENECNRRRSEVDRLQKASAEAKLSVVQFHSAIDAFRKELEHLSGELVAVDDPASKFDEKGRAEYRSFLRGKLREANHALSDLEDSLPGETERRDRAEAAFSEAEARLNESLSELAQREREIRDLREALARSEGAHAQSVLRPVEQ